ncbi:hypothetical protein PUR32_41925 [Streptomyces sp. BE133]|nr:hypothetical protein [Streptomyces sp. BE133]MEE1812503.1 hypothetical protein [Streptomyces sp. BE133]
MPGPSGVSTGTPCLVRLVQSALVPEQFAGLVVHAVAEPAEDVPDRAAQGGPLVRRPGAVPRARTAELLLEELPQRAEFVGERTGTRNPSASPCRQAVPPYCCW